VRRLIRATMAVAAGLVLAASTAVPAAAEPAPDRDEWWFDSYAIQSKVWPLTKGAGVTVAVIDTGVSAELPVFSGGSILPGTDFDGNGGDGRQDTDSGTGHGTGMVSLIAGQVGGSGGCLDRAYVAGDSLRGRPRRQGHQHLAGLNGARPTQQLSATGPGRCRLRGET
jgi:subtilisin family serine protease